MPDWYKSMQQTFEYYVVDPGTWKDVRRLDNIKKSNIVRDSEADTLGNATIDITETIDECYVRIYLVTIQNGVTERIPLGTYLVQTPSSSFNGKVESVSLDAYTPLIELKESPPPIGYSVMKNTNIMERAYMLIREKLRAPVVQTTSNETLAFDFVANTNDTWFEFTRDLIGNAKFNFDLDEMGRVLFAPVQSMTSLQPVWEYNDDNSSILLPEATVEHDLYGVPNVVEVVYSNGSSCYYARAVNDSYNSPVSTVNRGREIVHRVVDPEFTNYPTNEQIDEYAEQLLSTLSTLEYTITYTHAYCPTRVGDCVRLNYTRAGLTDIKAKVIRQSIECRPGCPVTEKAVYTKKLWR